MMKRKWISLLLCLAALLASACAGADSVTKMHYVFQNWSGDYTGQVDTGSIPFGFGIFQNEKPLEGENWHYIGSWEAGLPEGEGSVYFENGSMWKGMFSKGELIDGYKYSVSGLAAVPVSIVQEPEETTAAYIGNKKSMRFHLPNCRAVSQMKDKNKVEFKSREEAVDRGYIPCGECNP